MPSCRGPLTTDQSWQEGMAASLPTLELIALVDM